VDTRLGRHAIVVGAGIAGLAAAAALSDHFEHVAVLERDELPPSPGPRPGAPQSTQLHGLLGGGQRALSTLFPGFDRDLAEAGAVAVRIGLEDRLELPGYDPCPRRDLGMVGFTMTRPLLERTLARRLRLLPNVTLHERCRVLEILADDDVTVGGVRCQGIHGVEGILPADLIVDASARGALTLSLLKAGGWPEVEQTDVGINIHYATTTFAAPCRARDWKAAMTFPDGTSDTKTGYVFEVEGDRLMALVSERHAPAPAADHAGFLELLRQLRTPTLYDALRDAEPLDKVHRFAFPESSWRHYERLTDFPRGLVPIGDAICRFNPVYGQGMAMATLEACVLKDVLRERAGESDPLAGLGQAYFAGVQPFIATAWSMSATPDFIHPLTRGTPPADLEKSLRFSAALYRIAARDPGIHRLAVAVRHLVEPPAALHDPDLVRRVEAEMADA
jgi:2-polyprenyl-6-methoxyphenol hydroxylase-like FAD-dependent oxidoreductase